jgi:hypothetical protein
MFAFFFSDYLLHINTPHSCFVTHPTADFSSTPTLSSLCSNASLHTLCHHLVASTIIVPHNFHHCISAHHKFTIVNIFQPLAYSSLCCRLFTITIRFTVIITLHPFTRNTMNAFPNGTRVFYWDGNGAIKYGTVESTSRMVDGTQVLNVRVDGAGYEARVLVDEAGSCGSEWVEIYGVLVSLPISSVSKVT